MEKKKRKENKKTLNSFKLKSRNERELQSQKSIQSRHLTASSLVMPETINRNGFQTNDPAGKPLV